MFGLLLSRKLIFSGIILLAITGVIGYYYYQMNSKNNQIIKLQNKNVIQKVKINNLHTKIVVQKVTTKNKVFEAKEKQIKRRILNDSIRHNDTTVHSAIGDYNLSI